MNLSVHVECFTQSLKGFVEESLNPYNLKEIVPISLRNGVISCCAIASQVVGMKNVWLSTQFIGGFFL